MYHIIINSDLAEEFLLLFFSKTDINIVDKSEKLNKIKLVTPNIIYNRFDLKYSGDFELLEIKYGKRRYYIPLKINNTSCKLGLYMTEIDKNVLNRVLHFLSCKYGIYKFNISKSFNYYNGMKSRLNWVLDLPETVEEYDAKFSSKSKYNRRYLFKKLKNLYDIKYEYYSENQITLELLKEFLDKKRINYPDIYPSDYTAEDFQREFAVTDVYTLVINGEIAAMILYSILNDYDMYCVAITYDKKYSQFGIGTLLYYHSVNELIKRKYKRIYLGGGNDKYKENSQAKKYKIYNGSFEYMSFFERLFSIRISYSKEKINKYMIFFGKSFLLQTFDSGEISSAKFFNNINFTKRIKYLVRKYNNKKVVIYGAGTVADIVMNNYDLSGLNIVGVCDKSFTSNSPAMFHKYPAITFEELENSDCDVVLVLLARVYDVMPLLKIRLQKSVVPMFEF